jgi:steroid delta-isomerase-like uncharacterized protein
MSKESKNKENIRRHVDEVWNKGNLAIIPELIHDNFSFSAFGQEFKGAEGFKQMINMARTAFPDLHYTIDEMIAEGDTVAVRYTFTGTMKGELMGMKPTGKKLTMTSAIFHHFAGGKHVGAHSYSDSLTMYQQLGIPIPQQ